MVGIRLHNLTKHFGPTTAVDRVDLQIQPGELFFLLGPSGCGKSTLLRMIAGLIEPSSGAIHFGEREVTHLPTGKRNTAMVFQSYALWPHMTVRDNVAFGLDVRGTPAADKAGRVEAALQRVRMSEYAERKPAQLSGGQQQRVALARALVVRPDVLLLDEPLSNLDAHLRLEMRGEIRRICHETRITTVYVTHDQEEALSMADRIAVMRDGRVVQVGTPRDVYRRPADRFVAGFLGRTNLLCGTVCERANGLAVVETPAGKVRAAADGTGAPVGAAVVCSIRPEALRPLAAGESAENVLSGTIVDAAYLGHLAQVVVRAAGELTLYVDVLRPEGSPSGEAPIRLGVDARDVILLPD